MEQINPQFIDVRIIEKYILGTDDQRALIEQTFSNVPFSDFEYLIQKRLFSVLSEYAKADEPRRAEIQHIHSEIPWTRLAASLITDLIKQAINSNQEQFAMFFDGKLFNIIIKEDTE